MSNGNLEERFREKEEARNEAHQKIVSESLESLRRALSELLKKEISITKSAIEAEAEKLKRASSRLYRLSLLNPVLVGLSILLGLVIGTWGLSYYLSTTLREQFGQIEINKIELSYQAAARKKGYFYDNQDGTSYVRVVPGSEFKDTKMGWSWAYLYIEK